MSISVSFRPKGEITYLFYETSPFVEGINFVLIFFISYSDYFLPQMVDFFFDIMLINGIHGSNFLWC